MIPRVAALSKGPAKLVSKLPNDGEDTHIAIWRAFRKKQPEWGLGQRSKTSREPKAYAWRLRRSLTSCQRAVKSSRTGPSM